MAYKKAEFWNLNWGNEDTWLLKFLAYLPICSIEKFQSIPIFTYWLLSVCNCISHHWLSSRYLHQLDLGYYKVITFFFPFFSTGSASTGSTKSATMELYTSSYNETMSGGGETLSSISEKSCISDQTRPISGNGNNQTSNGLVGHGGVLQGGGGGFPPQAYLMVGHYCI